MTERTKKPENQANNVPEEPKSVRTSTIAELQRRIGEANEIKGFHDRGAVIREAAHFIVSDFDKQRSDEETRDYYTSRLALITTEVAEAIEHLRSGRAADEIFYEATEHGPKPDGVAVEVVDVIIRAFDFLYEIGADGEALIESKLAYNAGRGAKHGRKF